MNVNSPGFGRTIAGYDNNGTPSGGDGTVVISFPSITTEALKTSGSIISKLEIATYDEYFAEDEIIEATIDTLKEIEENAQKDLFEDATNLDQNNILEFSSVAPPAVAYWIDYIGSDITYSRGMSLRYDVLHWENSKYPGLLKQSGNFWQPGGHYFSWSDKFLKTKCYTMGPVQTVYDAQFVHHRHGGTSEVMDAGHAYAGWGRVEYYEAIIWSRQILGQKNQPAEPDALAGARNGVMGGNG